MTSALSRRGTAPGRHVYDAIVIGGQLAGSLATALLARHGLQVLHVPHDGLGARYDFKGEHLPVTPLLVPPLKSIAALDTLLSDLGLNQAVARALVPHDVQVLTPGNWFELKRDEKDRAVELKRALRTGADAFELELQKTIAATSAGDAFLQAKPDFPAEGFFGRWRLKRLLARLADGLDATSPLSTTHALRALGPFAAPVEGPAALSQARVLGRFAAGLSTFPNGREGLSKVLADRARELGADVLGPGDAVEALTFEGSTVGVRLVRSDTVYRAPFVLGAIDLEQLTALVPENKQAAARKALPRLTSTRAIFTLNAVVPEAALPRGLGRLAIVQPDDGAPLLLELTDASTADLRVLTVSTVVDRSLRGDEKAVRAFAATLWARLEFVLPFTRAQVKHESMPWLDADQLVASKAEPAPLFGLPADSVLGLTGHPTASPWKRVLLANRQVYPGLGLEGEAMAATRAVERLEKLLKKHDPLKAGKTS
jgi:phytoene dehydrogenase-like protein